MPESIEQGWAEATEYFLNAKEREQLEKQLEQVQTMLIPEPNVLRKLILRDFHG